MSKIHVVDVRVTGDVQRFSEPFKFEVHFECLESVREAIEFKVIYVGKADNEQYDQELDKVELDDVPVGMFKFTLECNAPDSQKIPADDLLGVTVILICGMYKDREFVRIGYYVHVTYDDQELIEDPPLFPVYEKLTRQLMVDAPRVTHFSIPWDSNIDDCESNNREGSESEPIRQYMRDATEYIKEIEAKMKNNVNGSEGANDKTDENSDDQFMLY